MHEIQHIASDNLRGMARHNRFLKIVTQHRANAHALNFIEVGDDLRGAFEHADAVLAEKQSGWCNVDAALLKSIVYLKAGVAPSAVVYARLADQLHPNNAAAAGIIRRMQSARIDDYDRISSSAHPHESGFRITIWQAGCT